MKSKKAASDNSGEESQGEKIEQQTKAEVGILLLHGIGNQLPGQTLVDYGDPLIHFLQRWIEGANENGENVGGTQKNQGSSKKPQLPNTSLPERLQVKIHEAVLTEKGQGEPAHVLVDIIGQDEKNYERWIVAESHWADSFTKPYPTAVTLWLMKITPWVWITFFSRRLRLTATVRTGQSSSWSSKLVWMVTLLIEAIVTVAASPIVLLLELILLVLLIIGPIPIPFIQQIVERIQAIFSSILGDSYIFTSSAIRREAVIKKVAEDLRWLEARCKNVVVLAHSQGAAVAYLTLRKHLSNQIRLLITFGSGLLKLFQLSIEQGKKNSVIISSVASLSLMSAVYLTLGLWIGFLLPPPTDQEYLLGVAIVVVLVFAVVLPSLALAVILAMEEDVGEIEKWVEEYSQGGRIWADLYASWDPVPNGPLFLRSQTPVESIEILNESSLLRDHNAYQDNVDEFYAELISLIGRSGVTRLPIAQLTSRDDWAITRAKWLRRHRVRFYRLDTTFLFIAAVAMLLNRDFVNWLGTEFNRIVNSVCLVWSEAANITGSATCWDVSPGLSGSIMVLLGWTLLNLAVQFSVLLNESFHQDMLFDRSASFSLVRDSYLGLIQHSVSGMALTMAFQMYSSYTFGWVRAFVSIIPNFNSNIIYFQGQLLGLLLGLVMTLFDRVRTFVYLRKKKSELNEWVKGGQTFQPGG